MTGEISLRKWRDDWREYMTPPDSRDHVREAAFLAEHGQYGATIHKHAADVIFAALSDERNAAKRHTLTLRLFTEFANALESLAAWGWTLQRRRGFRLFLDGFLSYPTDAAPAFYRDVATRPEDCDVVQLLDRPPRADVIFAARGLAVGGSTARDAGGYLDAGMHRLRQAADQFFAGEMALLRHYNRAKHGTSMIRLDEHTNDELDFQVLAPERHLPEIAAGAWYNVGDFRADEEMVGRIHRNVGATTHSIQFLSTIAWALYRAGGLYADPTLGRSAWA